MTYNTVAVACMCITGAVRMHCDASYLSENAPRTCMANVHRTSLQHSLSAAAGILKTTASPPDHGQLFFYMVFACRVEKKSLP